MKTILITGGAGFIGSNFIRFFLDKYQTYKIINLDKLTYAGNLANLKDIENNPNYKFIKGDIANQELVQYIFSEYKINYLINFAAQSHVDKSITGPTPFIKTNIEGTQVLLEVAKEYGIDKFIQISTDEVYGELGNKGYFNEKSPLKPNNPYAASKASADLIARSYYQTYNLPVIITRSSNNFGPFQYPEKLIPLFITNALKDKELTLYGDGKNIRDWLYVKDNCRAIDLILKQGQVGEIYNVGANNERTNLEVTEEILNLLGKDKSLITYVKDRLAHDYRYALDTTKIKELGFKAEYDFKRGLKKTIDWYLEHY
ncbi:dTDP-glucose 4,6-dehydratase [Natroniella acetigena]|uniref:dTDP-glucose 4,6-dehydratase n=1 Tax=Natroniella acetigena TaxID=52004 RepID=UPI00200A8CEE|nr:dTDP-glucose 4,6-dehydratase [Natroniella acetigena]MCK8827694.1 dTDP-glucose 4,6-dehydratase [Natroniella acetigena]